MATKHTGTEDTPTSNLDRLRTQLGKPIDIAGLVYFRIAFGAIMLWVDRYYTAGHGTCPACPSAAAGGTSPAGGGGFPRILVV